MIMKQEDELVKEDVLFSSSTLPASTIEEASLSVSPPSVHPGTKQSQEELDSISSVPSSLNCFHDDQDQFIRMFDKLIESVHLDPPSSESSLLASLHVPTAAHSIPSSPLSFSPVVSSPSPSPSSASSSLYVSNDDKRRSHHGASPLGKDKQKGSLLSWFSSSSSKLNRPSPPHPPNSSPLVAPSKSSSMPLLPEPIPMQGDRLKVASSSLSHLSHPSIPHRSRDWKSEAHLLVTSLKDVINALADQFGGTGIPIHDAHPLLTRLIRIVEVIFYHGFKEKRPGSGRLFYRKLELWEVLADFLQKSDVELAKESFETIKNMDHLTSSPSRIRAWIRYCLTSQAIGKICQSIIDLPSSLSFPHPFSSYYHPESCFASDTAISVLHLLVSLEAFDFHLDLKEECLPFDAFSKQPRLSPSTIFVRSSDPSDSSLIASHVSSSGDSVPASGESTDELKVQPRHGSPSSSEFALYYESLKVEMKELEHAQLVTVRQNAYLDDQLKALQAKSQHMSEQNDSLSATNVDLIKKISFLESQLEPLLVSNEMLQRQLRESDQQREIALNELQQDRKTERNMYLDSKKRLSVLVQELKEGLFESEQKCSRFEKELKEERSKNEQIQAMEDQNSIKLKEYQTMSIKLANETERRKDLEIELRKTRHLKDDYKQQLKQYKKQWMETSMEMEASATSTCAPPISSPSPGMANSSSTVLPIEAKEMKIESAPVTQASVEIDIINSSFNHDSATSSVEPRANTKLEVEPGTG